MEAKLQLEQQHKAFEVAHYVLCVYLFYNYVDNALPTKYYERSTSTCLLYSLAQKNIHESLNMK